ncbi:MAG: hypothetical protein JST35_00480 [Armatimonadetes bacterium]|nr:hypothetical protein [Armatimonadota bacterium]
MDTPIPTPTPKHKPSWRLFGAVALVLMLAGIPAVVLLTVKRQGLDLVGLYGSEPTPALEKERDEMKRYLLRSYRVSIFPDGHFERKLHRTVTTGDWSYDGKTLTLTYRESRTSKGVETTDEKPSPFAVTREGDKITIRYMDVDLTRLSTAPDHLTPE